MYHFFKVLDTDSGEEEIFSTEAETTRCVADYLRNIAGEMERGTFDGLDLQVWGEDKTLLYEIII